MPHFLALVVSVLTLAYSVQMKDMITIKVLGLDKIELNNTIEKLNRFKPKLSAEKVDDQAIFDLYFNLSFEYDQGVYVNKPIMITGRKINQNQTSRLRLIGPIYKSDVALGEISLLISKDPE